MKDSFLSSLALPGCRVWLWRKTLQPPPKMGESPTSSSVSADAQSEGYVRIEDQSRMGSAKEQRQESRTASCWRTIIRASKWTAGASGTRFRP